MTSRPDLTLCVINYNGKAYLEETLRAAVEQSDLFSRILLVDNGSDDGSVDLVKNEFPSVQLILRGENEGPAAARNRGWRRATTNRILFLDNDVALTRHCVQALTEALDSHSDAVTAMPTILYASDPETVQYDGAELHYLGHMILHYENLPRAKQEMSIRKIGSVVTSCFLVDRARWGNGDPFDESFFIYFEDHDFGIRVRLRGGEILSVRGAACFHREGTEGLSLRKTGRYTRRRVTLLIRNRWQIIARCYSARTLLFLSPLLFFYEFTLFLTVVARGWIVPWTLAVAWMIKHGNELFRRRRTVQQSRLLSDREIMRGGPIPLTEQMAGNRMERMAKSALNFVVQQYWNLVHRAI